LKLCQSPTADGHGAVGLPRRGVQLEYLTLAWNGIGAVVTLAGAMAAHSPALAGFGLASLIAIFVSSVVIWKLTDKNGDHELRNRRLIGYAFLALVMYLLTQSTWILTGTTRPDPSKSGLIWLAASLVVMLFLARGKQAIGQRLRNPVLLNEATMTFLNAMLAGTVLLGLASNAAFGWWWADPAAAFVIVAYGLYRGLAALD